MKFYDLLDLPFVSDSDKTYSCDELQTLLPSTPLDVIEQFYSDHGMNTDYQEDYGDVVISDLVWEEVYVSAGTLFTASINAECLTYFTTVKTKSSWVKSNSLEGYNFPDAAVVEYWKKNKTWCRSPIIFDEAVFSNKENIRLAEGHTRLGTLCGFIESGVINKDTQHKIWLGRYKNKAA